MDEPPVGQNVRVTLPDGSTDWAYWDGTRWMVGVDDNPVDSPLGQEVIAWALVVPWR